MRKLISVILVISMMIPICMFSASGDSSTPSDVVLYVKDGGTGEGTSPDSALPTLQGAVDKAATYTDDVTIKIIGSVTLDTTAMTSSYAEPVHSNKITWTAYDENAKLIVKSNTSTKKSYIMNGELNIEDLDIEVQGNRQFVIITQLNDITFGDGVTVSNSSGSTTNTCTIVGVSAGANKPSYFYDSTKDIYEADPTITLKSGSFYQVVGYMANYTSASASYTRSLDGDLTINVSGTASINKLYAVCNSYNTVKNCTFNISGGKINEYAAATDRPYTSSSGKSIFKTAPSGVTGTMTVNLKVGYDVTKQSSVANASALNGLCGVTANMSYAGALDDTRLGTFVLNIDEDIYDDVVAATDKVFLATFDEYNKIIKPADSTTEDTTTTTTAPEGPLEPEAHVGNIIYVSDGAQGNGMSADNALGSFEQAIALAASKTDDCEIRLVGSVTLDLSAAHYNEPVHSNKITWTGNDENAKLNVKTPTTNSKYYYLMNGELAVEDLSIEVTSGKYLLVWMTQLNDITIGDGVSIENTTGDSSLALYTASIRTVMNGYTTDYNFDEDNNCYKGEYNITIKSGHFNQVVGFMADASTSSTADLDGDVTISISGDAKIEKLYAVCNSYNTVNNALIYLDGGEIVQYSAASDRKGSGMTSNGPSGVKENYIIVLTKNFDISKSANKTNTSSVFYGISGTTAAEGADIAVSIDGNGVHTLYIEQSIYDAVISATDKINAASFDNIVKIDDSTGLDITIPDTDAGDDTAGGNGEAGDTSDNVGNVIYVADGATGDGSSVDNALGSLTAAITLAAAKEDDVIIKLVGEVLLDLGTDTFTEPRHLNKITWTAHDDNAKLVVKSNTTTKRSYVMNGELNIEDLDIEVDGNRAFIIITQLNDITVGDGVTIKNKSGSAANTCSIIGISAGSNKPSYFYDADEDLYRADPTITLKSGSFYQVVGFMANYTSSPSYDRNLIGDLTINVSGTASINKLYAVCNSYNTVTNCTFNISGGMINEYAAATDRPYTNSSGKSISQTAPSGVVGTMTVNLKVGYDVTKQSSVTNTAALNGLCGVTASKNYAGALDDERLGKFILNIDEDIYDSVIVSDDKVFFVTFDECNKITKTGDSVTAPEQDLKKEEYIYVSDGGQGDGSSQSCALGSLYDAIDKAASCTENAVIKISGTVTLDITALKKSYTEPRHLNKITFTAAENGGKLIVKTSSSKKYNYILNGEFEMRDLEVEISGDRAFIIITQLNDITIGDGVTIKNTADDTNKNTCSIVGINAGSNKPTYFYDKTANKYKADPTITLNSGSFYQVIGFMANYNVTALTEEGMAANLEGKLTINLDGSASVDRLYAVCNSFNTVRDFDLNITGGTINEYAGATDRPYTHKSSRSIKDYGLSGVTGTMNVYIGGSYDVTKQSSVKTTSAFNGLCGVTLNKAYAGALDDTRLGTFILRIDKRLYDKVIAADSKINFNTFDRVLKVDAVNAGTQDTISTVIFVMLIALTTLGVVAVTTEKKQHNR